MTALFGEVALYHNENFNRFAVDSQGVFACLQSQGRAVGFSPVRNRNYGHMRAAVEFEFKFAPADIYCAFFNFETLFRVFAVDTVNRIVEGKAYFIPACRKSARHRVSFCVVQRCGCVGKELFGSVSACVFVHFYDFLIKQNFCKVSRNFFAVS